MKAAIFDLDGVLIDSEFLRIATYSKLLEQEFNVSVSLDPLEYIGYPEEKNLFFILKRYGLTGDVR